MAELPKGGYPEASAYQQPGYALGEGLKSKTKSIPKKLRLLRIAITVGALGIALLPAAQAAATNASVQITATPAGVANFQVGYDYTQDSHLASGTGGDPVATSSAEKLLTSLNTFQNVALMGWGAGDPEPTPGNYNWSSLDARVEVMGATVPENQRMITLCSAPAWMKVGGTSQEWNLKAPVAPAHFQDFANLAAQVAERYDGTRTGANGQLLPKVDYFDVWNELKGLWNAVGQVWDYQDYTTLYNDVYVAIKSVRPDALIGGPYSPLGARQSTSDPSIIRGGFGVVDQRALDAVTYWLQHKVGAQFISVDGGPATTAGVDFAQGQYFVAVARWLRSLDEATYPGATSLPLVWSEFYPGITTNAGKLTGQAAVAIDMSNIIQAGMAGVDKMLVWEMEGDASGVSPHTGEAVWTSTAQAGGGQPTGFYDALQGLQTFFPPGTPLYATTVSGPVLALASQSHVLVINETDQMTSVDVDGEQIPLGPYAVEVVAATPAPTGPTPTPTSSAPIPASGSSPSTGGQTTPAQATPAPSGSATDSGAGQADGGAQASSHPPADSASATGTWQARSGTDTNSEIAFSARASNRSVSGLGIGYGSGISILLLAVLASVCARFWRKRRDHVNRRTE